VAYILKRILLQDIDLYGVGRIIIFIIIIIIIIITFRLRCI